MSLTSTETAALSLLKGAPGSGKIAIYVDQHPGRQGHRLYVDRDGEGESRIGYRVAPSTFYSLVKKGFLVNSENIQRFGSTYSVYKLQEVTEIRCTMCSWLGTPNDVRNAGRVCPACGQNRYLEKQESN